MSGAAPSVSNTLNRMEMQVVDDVDMDIGTFVDQEVVRGVGETEWTENLAAALHEDSRRQFGDGGGGQIRINDHLSEIETHYVEDLADGFVLAWDVLTDGMQARLDSNPDATGVADENDLDTTSIAFAWDDAGMKKAVARYERKSGLSCRNQLKIGEWVEQPFRVIGKDEYGEEIVEASFGDLSRKVFEFLHEVKSDMSEFEDEDSEDVNESAALLHMDRAEMQSALALQYSMLQETAGSVEPSRAKMVENQGMAAFHGGQWPDQNPHARTAPEHRIWLDSFCETAALRHPSLSRKAMREVAFGDGRRARGMKSPHNPYRDTDLIEAFRNGLDGDYAIVKHNEALFEVTLDGSHHAMFGTEDMARGFISMRKAELNEDAGGGKVTNFMGYDIHKHDAENYQIFSGDGANLGVVRSEGYAFKAISDSWTKPELLGTHYGPKHQQRKVGEWRGYDIVKITGNFEDRFGVAPGGTPRGKARDIVSFAEDKEDAKAVIDGILRNRG